MTLPSPDVHLRAFAYRSLVPTELGYAPSYYRGAMPPAKVPEIPEVPVPQAPADDWESYFQRHPEARARYDASQNRIRVRNRGGKFRRGMAKRAVK